MTAFGIKSHLVSVLVYWDGVLCLFSNSVSISPPPLPGSIADYDDLLFNDIFVNRTALHHKKLKQHCKHSKRRNDVMLVDFYDDISSLLVTGDGCSQCLACLESCNKIHVVKKTKSQ